MSPRPRKSDPHLPRCVYRRHGAYYLVRQGKWIRLGAELKSALSAYGALLGATQGGMGRLIDEALPHILASVKPATRRQYMHCAGRLKRYFAEFTPEQVTPRDVAAMKRGLAAKPNYANRCLSVLRQIFDYALEEQLIERNPAVGVKRHPEKKRDRLLTPAEYAAIYTAAGPRLRVIMELCIRTGQRIGDVLRIRRADLTDEGIRFQQSKTDNKGVVGWTAELRGAVERAKALPGGKLSGLTLLVNRCGKAPDYSTVKIQWDAARRAAGVADARLHDLRAFAATWAKKQGKNATALLMHSSEQQTRRYLRDKEEPVVEGPDFGQVVDGNWTAPRK